MDPAGQMPISAHPGPNGEHDEHRSQERQSEWQALLGMKGGLRARSDTPAWITERRKVGSGRTGGQGRSPRKRPDKARAQAAGSPDDGLPGEAAGARRRRTPDADAWTLEAFDRYDAEVRPADLADVVVKLDDPRRPAVLGLP